MSQLLKNGTAIKPVQFVITDADGALTNADSLPTGTTVVNGQDDGGISVTVTNVSTGAYYASLTPSGLSSADYVQVRISATVGGTATGDVLTVGQIVPADTYNLIDGTSSPATAAAVSALNDFDPAAESVILLVAADTYNLIDGTTKPATEGKLDRVKTILQSRKA